MLYDNVLPTSYSLPLNHTVKIRSANGTINEVSVFQANVTSRQGMINGSVEIGLVPREFMMPDGALCLIGDDYGARPVLRQPVHVVTRAQAKVQAAETSQAGDVIERVESSSNSAVNETNVSHVASTVETAVNSNKHSSVGFDNESQSFINRAE